MHVRRKVKSNMCPEEGGMNFNSAQAGDVHVEIYAPYTEAGTHFFKCLRVKKGCTGIHLILNSWGWGGGVCVPP